ncbi:RNA-binding protein [Cellulomonas cellasea]|uniref:Small subunit ribosomal protein S1 n=1 Tax=Cellulomonas cellasea TaxID=43670 RepID=A0A7W4YDF2_9CELL|nr:RNA-binding protein [Cellulomonas cellasea]MBB2924491.1 small subunit ribosomal protein S1 [Cellulomonas cellasea]
MVLPYAYQVAQYDPRDYGPNGYIGPLDSDTDEGPREAAYLTAIEAFARELGVTHLAVRAPRFGGPDPDEEPVAADDVLAQLFGTDLAGYVDGALVDIAAAQALVQGMFRGGTYGCELESDRMLVHVDWDMYMFVGTAAPCPGAVAATHAAGIFATECEFVLSEWLDEGLPKIDRPIDAVFWAEVDALVAVEGAVLLEELAAWGRWHRLTPGAPRPMLRPRCAVWVWPDLDRDVDAVLARPSDEIGLDTLVRLMADGALRSRRAVGEDGEDDVASVLVEAAGARSAWWRPGHAGRQAPLLEAVQPDADGIVRARWDRWAE